MFSVLKALQDSDDKSEAFVMLQFQNLQEKILGKQRATSPTTSMDETEKVLSARNVNADGSVRSKSRNNDKGYLVRVEAAGKGLGLTEFVP